MTDLLITQPLSLQGVLSDVMTNSFKRALAKAVQASDPAPLIQALFGGITYEVMNSDSLGNSFGELVLLKTESNYRNRNAHLTQPPQNIVNEEKVTANTLVLARVHPDSNLNLRKRK